MPGDTTAMVASWHAGGIPPCSSAICRGMLGKDLRKASVEGPSRPSTAMSAGAGSRAARRVATAVPSRPTPAMRTCWPARSARAVGALGKDASQCSKRRRETETTLALAEDLLLKFWVVLQQLRHLLGEGTHHRA